MIKTEKQHWVNGIDIRPCSNVFGNKLIQISFSIKNYAVIISNGKWPNIQLYRLTK